MMNNNFKKPTIKRVVALQYDPETDNAPSLTAYGQGEIAEKILEVAAENKIAIHQDQALIEILSTLELGSEIPEEIYELVAEILAFVYRLAKNNR